MDKAETSIDSLPHDAHPPSVHEETLVKTLLGDVKNPTTDDTSTTNEPETKDDDTSPSSSPSWVVDVVAFVVSYWVFDLVLVRVLVFMGAGPYLTSPLVVHILRVVSALALFLLLKHVRLSLS